MKRYRKMAKRYCWCGSRLESLHTRETDHRVPPKRIRDCWFCPECGNIFQCNYKQFNYFNKPCKKYKDEVLIGKVNERRNEFNKKLLREKTK